MREFSIPLSESLYNIHIRHVHLHANSYFSIRGDDSPHQIYFGNRRQCVKPYDVYFVEGGLYSMSRPSSPTSREYDVCQCALNIRRNETLVPLPILVSNSHASKRFSSWYRIVAVSAANGPSLPNIKRAGAGTRNNYVQMSYCCCSYCRIQCLIKMP